MPTDLAFSPGVLRLDAGREVDLICARIRDLLLIDLKRKGAVVGVSGGIDSSVVAYLCVRALGPGRVLLLSMPETDSSLESLNLGKAIASELGARWELEDIGPILLAAGCYERRDAAIRMVYPGFGPGYKCKIVLPNLIDDDRYSLFSVVVRSPDGVQTQVRLNTAAYLGIVAATNFKQRVRKMMEYHHADLLQYAVAGTPNLLEYELGFFVKNGDGAADFKPIAHLFKSQVYQLAAYLGVPQKIRERPATTDTYSLSQTQEEFYFSLPLDKMDLCLYGEMHRIPAGAVAPAVGLTDVQVERVYRLIEARQRQARYLQAPPLLMEHPE